eukprot:318854-Chlamydomonas_euryale.AAC.2
MLKFSLYGDAMNTSSRMESTCAPGCIHVSETTYELLTPSWRPHFCPRGGVQVKGKGLMASYMFAPDEAQLATMSADQVAELTEQQGLKGGRDARA